jgi:MFS family permease
MSDPQPVALNDSAPESPAPPRGAMLTIFLIVFIDLLGFGLIIPLLPFYARKYQATPLQVELLFSVYSICQFLAAPMLGMISDRVGRRPVLIISQIGSAAGYLLLGWATHHPWADPTLGLIVVYLSRVIDGVSGGNISTAQAYVADVTAPENRAKGMGMLGAAFGLGFVLGPGLGGLAGHLNESVPAYIAAALCVVAAVMTYLMLPESRVHRPAETEAWLHPSRFAPIFRRPVLAQLLFIWFTSMAAYVMMDASAVMFLEDIFGFGKLGAGLYFMFIGIIIVIVQGRLIGSLKRMFGEWWLCTVGVVLVGIGAAGTLATAWWPAVWLLAVGGIITATGRSFQQPSISALVSQHANASEQGVTMGLFQGLGSLARAFGPFVGGIAYGHTRTVVHPIRPYLIAAVILLLAGIWTWAVKRSARE